MKLDAALLRENIDDEEEEDDDEDVEESIPVQNESYVNLRKRMVKKTESKTEQIQQENKKLCREFKKKQVTHLSLKMTILIYLFIFLRCIVIINDLFVWVIFLIYMPSK